MQTTLKIKLLAHTPDADKLVAAAAKLCYSASDVDTLMDGLTADKVEAMCQKLADLGHDSPIEHASYTFAVEGVSRALLAQLTRHRLASYSVQSQRYVDKGDFDYVIPPSIAADPETAEMFEKCMAISGADLLMESRRPRTGAGLKRQCLRLYQYLRYLIRRACRNIRDKLRALPRNLCTGAFGAEVQHPRPKRA